MNTNDVTNIAIQSTSWLQISAWLALPDTRHLQNNGFLLKGKSSMLVDTGANIHQEAWLANIESHIDLAEIDWLWLSHVDQDHIGNLRMLLARAKQLTVLAAPLTFAKLDLAGIRPKQVKLITEGDHIEIGDHHIEVIKPPVYDAPETLGFFDHYDGVMFLADSYGTPFIDPKDAASHLDQADFFSAMREWATIDVPWLSMIDNKKLLSKANRLSAFQAEHLLTSHLPNTTNRINEFTTNILG